MFRHTSHASHYTSHASHYTSHASHYMSHTSHYMSHAESTGCVPVVEYDRNFWQGAYRNVFECSGAGSGASEAAVLPFAFVRDGWSNVDIVVTFPNFTLILFLPPPALALAACCRSICAAAFPRPRSPVKNPPGTTPLPQPSCAAAANQISALFLTPLQGYDHFVTQLTSCVGDMMRV